MTTLFRVVSPHENSYIQTLFIKGDFYEDASTVSKTDDLKAIRK